MAIVEQYIIPLVHNSLLPFHHNDVVRIAERILKLSLPNVGVWLLGFYVFFHLYLNITAEILRFGDRQFYKDWW
jgi:diacylglycerol O-acyltransferase-1